MPAGDWVKVRHGLAREPEVIEMAARLDVSEFAIVGRFVELWSWYDEHVSRSRHADVTPTSRSDRDVVSDEVAFVAVRASWIDRLVGLEGFAAAAESVGWLVVEADRIGLPRIGRHVGKTAKERALAAMRKRAERERKEGNTSRTSHDDVTPESRSERDESVYRKRVRCKKEKEDKSIDVPNGTSHPTTAVPAPLGSGGEDDSTDSPDSPETRDVAPRRAQAPDMTQESCEAANVAQSGEEALSRARSSRIVPATEWSEYVAAWNAAAAPNGLPCAAPGETALSTQSRRRFHAIAPAESDRREIFARVLAEVDQSAPGILALSGGRWFSLHWLFGGQGTHVEKFVAGQYRRTSSAEAERDARIRRALAEEDAAC